MRGFKHFFATPPIQTPDLTIRGIGVRERMPPSIINRPHGTGDHLFMLFHDPVWIGTGAPPVQHPSSTWIVWTPGRCQYYGNRERPYVHTWIHCDGRWIAAFLRGNGLPQNVPMPLANPSVMEHALLAIHEELTTHSRPDSIIVRNLLENWLREMSRRSGEKSDPKVPPRIFLEIRHHLETEYASPIRLPELARRAHLSVPHFCTTFKRHFGVSPIDYLIRHRMRQATHWLNDQNLNVTEVAARVGYEDLFYFSKLFKKHHGVSPLAYRKQQGKRG
jgi:AraC-like DNA-binding protein